MRVLIVLVAGIVQAQMPITNDPINYPNPVQAAADMLIFFLQNPGNCLQVHSDIPPEAPSHNMAALWIRGAFHDAGTYDPSNSSDVGGADGSVMDFLELPENGGLGPAMAPRFQQKPQIHLSDPDLIALAAQVSVSHCGGPNITTFAPGRVKADNPTNPVGRLPEGDEDFATAKKKLLRMGWTNLDIVALVTGSHSMGAVHKQVSPTITNKTEEFFDDTPGVFDNLIFKKCLSGNCVLPIDRGIANDPDLRPIVERFANDQDAFFAQYTISFNKLINNQTTASLGNPVAAVVKLHENLLSEGSVPNADTKSVKQPSGAESIHGVWLRLTVAVLIWSGVYSFYQS